MAVVWGCRRLGETVAQFAWRMSQVENHMNSAAFCAASGRGLQGLATEMRARCTWVARNKSGCGGVHKKSVNFLCGFFWGSLNRNSKRHSLHLQFWLVGCVNHARTVCPRKLHPYPRRVNAGGPPNTQQCMLKQKTP